ncbi:MAG: response regulator [Spirochaetia bacterium]|nr:response regulator [Spirochaetia bacterium]
MKVLLVEDDILIRIFIKKGLLNNGCDEVFEASKADEALYIIKNKKPDVVFLDIKLKGKIDGVEIARIIKNSADSQTLLVYMSAYDKAVFNEEEINALFDYHLSKPVNPSELKELCKKISAKIEEKNE